MAILQIPCPHNFYSNIPGVFTRKRVDVAIRFRISERCIFHFADGATPPFTAVNDGGVISRSSVHPCCPECKASLTSLYLEHGQPPEDCSSLLDLIAHRVTDEAFRELHRHVHRLKFPVDVEFDVVHHRLYVNDDDDDDDDDEEEEEVPLGLTPAIDEAIEGLERITLSKSEEATTTTTTTTCAICLEDLMKNTNEVEGVGRRLPCKHEFHEDCILQWLQTSHYCPLCRFELPA